MEPEAEFWLDRAERGRPARQRCHDQPRSSRVSPHRGEPASAGVLGSPTFRLGGRAPRDVGVGGELGDAGARRICRRSGADVVRRRQGGRIDVYPFWGRFSGFPARPRANPFSEPRRRPRRLGTRFLLSACYRPDKGIFGPCYAPVIALDLSRSKVSRKSLRLRCFIAGKRGRSSPFSPFLPLNRPIAVFAGPVSRPSFRWPEAGAATGRGAPREGQEMAPPSPDRRSSGRSGAGPRTDSRRREASRFTPPETTPRRRPPDAREWPIRSAICRDCRRRRRYGWCARAG